jgi:hypothetical protein
VLPRQDMTGWDWDDDASGVQVGALPLTGGSAFLDGNIMDRSGIVIPNGYTPDDPIRNTYADDATNVPGQNHGYGYLHDNPQLIQAIDDVSSQTGVPSQVLADVLAYSSGGTHDTSNVHPTDMSSVSGGILPYTAKEAYDLGVNPAILKPDEQVRLFLPSRIDALEGENTPHNVLASVLLHRNPEALSRYVNNPRAGDSLNNGVKSLNQAVAQLGTHAYRQYRLDDINPRAALQQRVQHNEHHKGCRWCESLAQSNSPFTPHEAQY